MHQVRDALELSLVADAEMVFTTLSSTGRRVFNRLESGHFETVLIDEAAQASEVTTLQALTFGCRRSGNSLLTLLANGHLLLPIQLPYITQSKLQYG